MIRQDPSREPELLLDRAMSESKDASQTPGKSGALAAQITHRLGIWLTTPE
jgi:hypothetical protein